jgi:hypothetical protein
MRFTHPDPEAPTRSGNPGPKPRKAVRPPADRLPKALTGPGRTPLRMARPAGGRTVVAVLGSVAALGGAAAPAAAATPRAGAGAGAPRPARTARRGDSVPAGELALLGLVFATLSAAAPAIARPLLDRGVAEATIIPAEADAFIARLTGVDATPDGATGMGTTTAAVAATAGVGGATPTPAAIALYQSVFAAIRAQLPVLARPLVRDALAGGTITEVQAGRIDQRMMVRAQVGIPGLPNRHTEPLFTGRLP